MHIKTAPLAVSVRSLYTSMLQAAFEFSPYINKQLNEAWVCREGVRMKCESVLARDFARLCLLAYVRTTCLRACDALPQGR